MDAVTMLNNVYAALQPFWKLFQIICYVAAFGTLAGGLTKMTDDSRGGNSPMVSGFILLMVSGTMAAIPTALSMFGETLVGTSLSSEALAFTSNAPTPISKAAIQVSIVLIKIVGITAVWKGLGRFKIYAAGNQDPKLTSEGFSLLIAGVLALFAPQFIRMIGNTLGGKVAEIVSTYI